MFVEAPIFGGDKCRANLNRDPGEGNVHTVHGRHSRQEYAVPVDDATTLRGAERPDLVACRAPLKTAAGQPAVGHEGCRNCDRERGKRGPVSANPDPRRT